MIAILVQCCFYAKVNKNGRIRTDIPLHVVCLEFDGLLPACSPPQNDNFVLVGSAIADSCQECRRLVHSGYVILEIDFDG